MFKVTMSGFDGFDDFKRRVEKAAKQKEVTFDELFTPEFMAKHSKPQTIDEFFVAGGFVVKSKADYEKIPTAKIDAYVGRATDFKSWSEMLRTAGAEHIRRQIGV